MGLITNFMVPLTGVYRKYILGKTVNTTVPLRGLIEIIITGFWVKGFGYPTGRTTWQR